MVTVYAPFSLHLWEAGWQHHVENCPPRGSPVTLLQRLFPREPEVLVCFWPTQPLGHGGQGPSLKGH